MNPFQRQKRKIVICEENETEEDDLRVSKLSSNDFASQSPPHPPKGGKKTNLKPEQCFFFKITMKLSSEKKQNVHGFRNKTPYILDSLVICQT